MFRRHPRPPASAILGRANAALHVDRRFVEPADDADPDPLGDQLGGVLLDGGVDEAEQAA